MAKCSELQGRIGQSLVLKCSKNSTQLYTKRVKEGKKERKEGERERTYKKDVIRQQLSFISHRTTVYYFAAPLYHSSSRINGRERNNKPEHTKREGDKCTEHILYANLMGDFKGGNFVSGVSDFCLTFLFAFSH